MLNKDTASNERIKNCIKADFLFQFKHGFYYIYIIISVVYIVLLSMIDKNILKMILPILIYTDPSVLGLFFIGGMVLLEKEQGILSLLYITPLKVIEYILSKILTLSCISMLAGLMITLIAYNGYVNYAYLIIGIFLTSIFYTLLGFIISSKAKSVNDYLVKMLPWMILFVIPCLSIMPNNFIPKYIDVALNIIPSVAGLKIVMGAFVKQNLVEVIVCMLCLIAINIWLLFKTKKIMTKKVMLDN